MASAKVMSADVHRIASVLDELTQKLTLLSFVTHQVLEAIHENDPGHATELLGPELLRRMAEQTRLEELYHRSTTNGDEGAVASLDVDDLQEIVEQLEKNTRELCRKMREVPNIVQELRVFQETRPLNSMKFIHALADMQWWDAAYSRSQVRDGRNFWTSLRRVWLAQTYVSQDVMLKRLTTPVEDEKANDDLLQMYLQQESVAAERRTELERQLAQLRSERQKHSQRSSEAITKLKSDLHDLQSVTEQKLWQMSEEFAKRYAQHTRAFQRKMGDIAALKAQLDKRRFTQSAAEREELETRSRNQRIAKRDLENTIRALDKDIAQKESEIEAARRKNRVDEELLGSMTTGLNAIDEEKERREQETRIAKALIARSEAEQMNRETAACVLQSYWRGIRQREEYVSLRKAVARKTKAKKAKKSQSSGTSIGGQKQIAEQ